MNLVERAKNICLTPATEWPVISGESIPNATVITSYVVPLAAVSAVAGFVGGSVIGRTLPFIGTYRVPFATGLGVAVFTVIMAVLGVYLVGIIIDALAPTFGAQKNSAQAFKVAAYSFTPAWIGGVFQVLPVLGILALLGALYGIYLLYLGLPRLMRCPDDKAIGYTAVVVICAIVVSAVVGTVVGTVTGMGMMGAGLMSGAALGGAGGPTASADPNSTLGRLEQFGRAMENSAKKAEAAANSGDTAGAASAAAEGLGALLGGGNRLEPIDVAQLKPFVPETFAGLARRSSEAEKTSFGLTITRAEGQYGDGCEKDVTLEVIDTGGLGGLMGLAGWMNVQTERETDDGVERTRKEGGRMVHERSSKSGSNEFSVVVGERFLVNTRGRGVDLDTLKSGVAALDLGALEAMKGMAGAK
jgi:hypothetical protein